MDYDSDSSDFHFPSDTELPKLSSPLCLKVPEAYDWALEEFMQIHKDKPCTDVENLLCFKQYIPVEEDEEEGQDSIDYPTKLNLPLYEEKELLQKLSHHFLNLERMELHDILKGGFTLVQNDIQSNQQQYNKAPGLSWFNEAIDFGHPTIETLDSIQEEQKQFKQFDTNNATKQVSFVKPVITTSVLPLNKKKGLKSKLKTSYLYQNTKKFIRKMLPVSSNCK